MSHTAVRVHDLSALAEEVQSHVDAQTLDTAAPAEPASAAAIAPPPRTPWWLTPAGVQQFMPTLMKWSAAPTIILGVVLVAIGATHVNSACPASKSLAAADIALGASYLVGLAYYSLQVLVCKRVKQTTGGGLISCAGYCVWLWAVIAIFQDDLFSRVYIHGDAAACDTGLYNPSAIIMLTLFALYGVIIILTCGFICFCIIPVSMAASSRAAAGSRSYD